MGTKTGAQAPWTRAIPLERSVTERHENNVIAESRISRSRTQARPSYVSSLITKVLEIILLIIRIISEGI